MKRPVIIIIGVVLGLACLICGIVAIATSDEPAVTPAPRLETVPPLQAATDTSAPPPPTDTAIPPTLPPPPTDTAVPTDTAIPTPDYSAQLDAIGCTCQTGLPDTDPLELDCGDFSENLALAQACHDRCMQLTGQDIYGLDGNDPGDGWACEYRE